ncbi:Spo0E family sporulation regulatory protein-aspartic acid phosphatase [Dethiobacter alkaliphilus]|uniref:Spo0E like sporulation regulatory protein n=1 Tax=Dethiobacter alkaliphilus AHT 1 TaxID=555088 RepID=C0GIX4_DETAL|nr:Spo0E family sporulation regulatory protein-aspartic acid phosphatase [Dethiobacter alkaliphilus]EEG76788.1 hypothetical protein DealDRAFT_2433 [Dethiobacter alkaliphilus AHT 1]
MDICEQALLEKLQQELLHTFYKNQGELCNPEVLCKSEELDELVLKIMRRRHV